MQNGFRSVPLPDPLLRSAIISCDLAAPSAIAQALGDNELPVEGTRSGYPAGAAGGRCSVSTKGGPGEGKLKLGRLLKLPTPLWPQTGPCAARSLGLAVTPHRAAPPTPPCPRGSRPQPPEPRAHTASAANLAHLQLHPREWRPAARSSGRTLSQRPDRRPPLPAGPRVPQK